MSSNRISLQAEEVEKIKKLIVKAMGNKNNHLSLAEGDYLSQFSDLLIGIKLRKYIDHCHLNVNVNLTNEWLNKMGVDKLPRTCPDLILDNNDSQKLLEIVKPFIAGQNFFRVTHEQAKFLKEIKLKSRQNLGITFITYFNNSGLKFKPDVFRAWMGKHLSFTESQSTLSLTVNNSINADNENQLNSSAINQLIPYYPNSTTTPNSSAINPLLNVTSSASDQHTLAVGNLPELTGSTLLADILNGNFDFSTYDLSGFSVDSIFDDQALPFFEQPPLKESEQVEGIFEQPPSKESEQVEGNFDFSNDSLSLLSPHEQSKKLDPVDFSSKNADLHGLPHHGIILSQTPAAITSLPSNSLPVTNEKEEEKLTNRSVLFKRKPTEKEVNDEIKNEPRKRIK